MLGISEQELINFLALGWALIRGWSLIRGGGTCIIASIIHEIHKCKKQEFYTVPFASIFYAQITRQ